MATVGACAYPWDLLDDPGAATRLRVWGADAVAVAVAYHAVRAATPQHPRRRVVSAPRSALYSPVRPEAWRGRAIVPEAPVRMPSDAAVRAVDSARAAGVRPYAWVVVSHLDDPRIAEHRVQNAFGDVYDYALCPAHPEVIDYAATLVAEAVRATGVDAVMLEATGPLGVEHQAAHEKTVGADWTDDEAALLSLCFCPRCSDALGARGADADAVRERVRRQLAEPGARDAASWSERLGDDAEALLAVRSAATARLTDTAVAAARTAGAAEVAVHAHPDPWAVGPFAAVLDGRGGFDTAVVPGGLAATWTREDADRARRGAGGARLGAWTSTLPPADPADFAPAWARMRARGVDELWIYHLGLVSATRSAEIAAALAGLER